MKNTISKALFLMIVTGAIFAFQACDSQEADLNDETNTQEESDVVGDNPSTFDDTPLNGEEEADSEYKDGRYAETGTYRAPSGEESVTVTVSIVDDVITDVEVLSNATNETSVKLQGMFIEGIDELVVGKRLSEIEEFANVNGSSLTPKGFQAAIEAIKKDAEA